MHSLVRQTLTTYLTEKRLPTLSEISSDLMKQYGQTQLGVFVTLYVDGAVIASSGRIQCKKESTIYECMDNTLTCLSDPRFSAGLQSVEELKKIHIRVDLLDPKGRRVIQSPEEMDITKEGLIFLSQNKGVMSILLPNIVNIANTPDEYYDIVVRKAGLDRSSLTPEDFVLYAIQTDRSIEA